MFTYVYQLSMNPNCSTMLYLCSPINAWIIIPNGVEHQKLWPRALKPAMRITPLDLLLKTKPLKMLNIHKSIKSTSDFAKP